MPRYLLGATKESYDCLLETGHSLISVRNIRITMKTNQTTLRRALCRIFRPRAGKHDPMLLLNMLAFNFTDGWSRTFSNYEYARSYA